LLKQQSLITVYCLPTKENKLPFSVCSNQTEVCHFRFLFAVIKWKLPFPLVLFFVYKYKYTQMLPFHMENGKLMARQFSLICLPIAYWANTSLLFAHLLTKKQAEVIHLQMDLPIYANVYI
jgi:hypothetical protein